MANDRILPRVAAIHDISGFGRVSLTEVLPILSAMGTEACPLPTAVLSTHTYDFQDYTLCDLTEEMPKIIQHWNQLGLQFDAVYSGYMSSPRQIAITRDFMKTQKEGGSLIVVDPVLGDHALPSSQAVYSSRMWDLAHNMKDLVSVADIITPNVTEACLLLGLNYPTAPLPNDRIKEMLHGLCDMGIAAAVITSVMDSENSMCVAVCHAKTGICYKINCGFVNRPFHGTGDVYTSVLTGALVQGMELIEAANLAADFVSHAIAYTIKHPEIPIRNGVLFEQVLASGYFAKGNYPQRYIQI